MNPGVFLVAMAIVLGFGFLIAMLIDPWYPPDDDPFDVFDDKESDNAQPDQ